MSVSVSTGASGSAGMEVSAVPCDVPIKKKRGRKPKVKLVSPTSDGGVCTSTVGGDSISDIPLLHVEDLSTLSSTTLSTPQIMFLKIIPSQLEKLIKHEQEQTDTEKLSAGGIKIINNIDTMHSKSMESPFVINYFGPKYTVDDDGEEDEYLSDWSTVEEQNVICCMNCSLPINPEYEVHAPIKFASGEFVFYGHFCSFPCVKSYISSHTSNWEMHTLLNYYYRLCTGKSEQIMDAPPKEMLKIYGGEWTKKEFQRHIEFVQTRDQNKGIKHVLSSSFIL